MLSYILWLILLLIIDCIVGKTIYYDVDRIRNSMCFNNKCVYKLRSRRQINLSKRKF
jgi:hypothetical protein